MIAALIRRAVRKLIDKKLWNARLAEKKEGRRKLGALADRWEKLTEEL